MTAATMQRATMVFGIVLAALALGVLAPRSSEARGRPSFVLPPTAVEVAPDVFSLGQRQHLGQTIEGVAIVHRTPPQAGRGGTPGPNGGSGGTPGSGGSDGGSGCYSFTEGRRWLNAEDFVFNPSNNSNASGLVTIFQGVLNEWDDEVNAEVFGSVASSGNALSADADSVDDVNEVYFGPIAQSGVIAVTTTWYLVATGEIVESDMVFDDVDYAWSTSGAAGAMDFENIAQHESGHSAGMGHTPRAKKCGGQTMYPTASYGETTKRDLGSGDIAGISALYN